MAKLINNCSPGGDRYETVELLIKRLLIEKGDTNYDVEIDRNDARGTCHARIGHTSLEVANVEMLTGITLDQFRHELSILLLQVGQHIKRWVSMQPNAIETSDSRRNVVHETILTLAEYDSINVSAR